MAFKLLKNSKQIDYKFKIIITGEKYSGKSSLFLEHSGNNFESHYKPSMGFEYKRKELELESYKILYEIWDTTGNRERISMTEVLYKRWDANIIVFDLGDRESLNNAEFWIENIRKNVGENILIVLVGNKIDEILEREINYEEGEEFAHRKDVFYMETSAASRINVDQLFEIIVNTCLSKYNQDLNL